MKHPFVILGLTVLLIAVGLSLSVDHGNPSDAVPAAAQSPHVPPPPQVTLTCSNAPDGITFDRPGVTQKQLLNVFNASGLGLVTGTDSPVILTATDYERWHRPGPAPHLLIKSALATGHAVGGLHHVGDFPSVEGIATSGQRVAFIFQRSDGQDVIRDGQSEIVLSGSTARAVMSILADPHVPKPRDIFFEGLAFTADGYEVLATAKHDTGLSDDDPRTPLAVFRARFAADGSFVASSPALHWPDGSHYNDYGGALDVADNGLAIVPGFYSEGVRLVATTGRIVGDIAVPTLRVEGVHWDPLNCQMYLVRECVGIGYECDELEPPGVTLWTLSPAVNPPSSPQ